MDINEFARKKVRYAPMVLMLEGNSEIFAHVWSEIDILIWIWHLSRSRAVANLIFISEFLYTRETCSDISSMIRKTAKNKKINSVARPLRNFSL